MPQFGWVVSRQEARLKPEHEEFARLLALGHSQSAAFRKVWPHSRCWQPESVHTAASRMAAKVAPRVAVLAAIASAEARVTLQAMIRQADADHAAAHDRRDPAAAIKATALMAKLCGLLPTRATRRVAAADAVSIEDLLRGVDGLDRAGERKT